MKIVNCNIAASACDNINNEFQAMFPSEMSSKFSMTRTKCGYYITDALGPHFREQLLEDLQNEYFSLSYDEMTNFENKKELQTKV